MTLSLKRAILGAVAICLVAVALVAPLGAAWGGAGAAAADVLPGDSVCVPVKGQRPLPDLAPVGLTPSGTEVVIQNVGCAPSLIAFNVWVALTDGEEIVVDVVRIEQFIQPGNSVRVPIAFDCQFDSAFVEVDRESVVLESNKANNTATFASIVC